MVPATVGSFILINAVKIYPCPQACPEVVTQVILGCVRFTKLSQQIACDLDRSQAGPEVRQWLQKPFQA